MTISTSFILGNEIKERFGMKIPESDPEFQGAGSIPAIKKAYTINNFSIPIANIGNVECYGRLLVIYSITGDVLCTFRHMTPLMVLNFIQIKIDTYHKIMAS